MLGPVGLSAIPDSSAYLHFNGHPSLPMIPVSAIPLARTTARFGPFDPKGTFDMINDEFLKLGFYTRGIFRVVSDAELRAANFIREMRNYATSLDVPYERMQDYMTSWYARAPIIFRDGQFNEVFVDTGTFEFANADYWFRDFCTRVPDNVQPRVRREAWERTRAFCSLLRAHKALAER